MSYRLGRLVASSTIARRRFDSTKSTELRFRALVTESGAKVRFHRDGTVHPSVLAW
jgi:hypothetical protein